jgi:Ni,Fe-hydrogenase III large subunit
MSGCRPWSRFVVDPATWSELAARPDLGLLALWADTVAVHALYRGAAGTAPVFVSLDVNGGPYPALSPMQPAAALFERIVSDLWGHMADGATDPGRWLDHGQWSTHHPMALRPVPRTGPAEPPEFLPATETDQAASDPPLDIDGPVRAAIAAPRLRRLTLDDAASRVARAEVRLGYAHKGALTLMRGKTPRAAARFAARLSADQTVAHATAFARATEAATVTAIPPRAQALRRLLAEQERLAGHLAQLAAVAGIAASQAATVAVRRLQATMLAANGDAFGHRLLMDAVVPGGVATDIAPGGADAIRRALDGIETALPTLVPLTRIGRGEGVITAEIAGRYAVDGPVAQASGLIISDTAPADDPALVRRAAWRITGDVAARSAVRLDEIAECIRLMRLLLTPLPDGPISVPPPPATGEGLGVAEGPRGACWHWLRLDGGLIAAAFTRDPAFAHWPLLAHAATGEAADRVDLIEASIGLAVSGVDL